jgi:hypothetical protein
MASGFAQGFGTSAPNLSAAAAVAMAVGVVPAPETKSASQTVEEPLVRPARDLRTRLDAPCLTRSNVHVQDLIRLSLDERIVVKCRGGRELRGKLHVSSCAPTIARRPPAARRRTTST